MKYIDAHCHLSDDTTNINVGAIYNAAKQSDWHSVINVLNTENDIFGAIGVHPWYVSEITDNWESELKELLSQNPDLLVGEIGLDKHRPDMETQTRVFCNQMLLASEFKRGVCLHSVGTWDKVLHVLKVFQNVLPPFIIAHCYSGNPDDIKMFAEKYNMYFSYGPRNLQDTVRLCSTPLNRIVAETDGKNPNDVIVVVNRIAGILNIAPDKMADIIYKNTIRMLGK